MFVTLIMRKSEISSYTVLIICYLLCTSNYSYYRRTMRSILFYKKQITVFDNKPSMCINYILYKCKKFYFCTVFSLNFLYRITYFFRSIKSTDIRSINTFINTRMYGAKTMWCNLLSKISVSAAFRTVSSGAKSLELQLAQVSQRMKGSLLPVSWFPCLHRKSKSGYGSRELTKVDNNKLFCSTIKFCLLCMKKWRNYHGTLLWAGLSQVIIIETKFLISFNTCMELFTPRFLLLLDVQICASYYWRLIIWALFL